MKRFLIPALLSLALAGCANVEVRKTYVASGATNPSGIYIRPFDVSQAVFVGDHGPKGQLEIRKSLAPAELGIALKEQLAKIAPAMILAADETPEKGWIVDGSIDLVDGGNQPLRFFLGHLGAGRTKAIVHVRVLDAAADETQGDGKGGENPAVLYAFDVEASSKAAGRAGSVYSAGTGSSEMFDYRNIAEEVAQALSPDPFRYGVRDGLSDR